MGVFGSITFSHTPEEAMSGGLAKACVPSKFDSVEEKLSFLMNTKQDEKSTFLYRTTSVLPSFSFNLFVLIHLYMSPIYVSNESVLFGLKDK